jgi:hypothetical protein
MTAFYCLRFETPPTWRTRSPYLYSPGRGWFGYVPRHWVPFSSPPTTRRDKVEVFDPASTRDSTDQVASTILAIHPRSGPKSKHRLPQLIYCCVCIRRSGHVFIGRYRGGQFLLAPLFQLSNVAPQYDNKFNIGRGDNK